jgi:hypothetical protein
MYRIVGIEEIKAEAWASLVKASGVATWFQTYEAFSFFDSIPFLTAFVFGLESDGRLKGLVTGYLQKDGGKLKQYFSKRAVIHGGPLLSDDISAAELSALLSACRASLKKKAIYIETRNLADYSAYKEIFEKNGFRYEAHLDFIVDTSSEEIVEKNLYKSKRKRIRSSLKEGAVVDENPSLDDVRAFYGLLHGLYSNKVKTPLWPLSFFEALYNKPFARFLLMKKDEVVIGGQLILIWEHNCVYLYYLCGEDGKYEGLYPSILGTYAGLQYAAKNGCPRCDMLGAGKPGQKYGVRDFKAEFGGTLVEYGRFLAVTQPLLYRIGCLGVKILKSKWFRR